MSEQDYWNQSNDAENFDYEDNGLSTYAMINGSTIELNPGDSFKDTILRLSRDAGFGKFQVYLNGDEVKPSESPESISEGDNIEVRQYDIAA